MLSVLSMIHNRPALRSGCVLVEQCVNSGVYEICLASRSLLGAWEGMGFQVRFGSMRLNRYNNDTVLESTTNLDEIGAYSAPNFVLHW